jgi:hypothetical protein
VIIAYLPCSGNIDLPFIHIYYSYMNNQDQEIHAIIERNKRVEAEKAWETSWFRRILISVITYISACAFLTTINEDYTKAYLPAFVPAIAYILSTMTLGPVKKWWIARKNDRLPL